ncbi:MAG: non-hydrolyzing UDP-N-acetylglucosamine 2-epimerase [Lachnospira sp.]
MKLLSVFGTRPEAIKMCPVIKELEKQTEIESIVCLTGQHEEMLNQVIERFKIKVNYNLHIMKKNQSLTDITCNVLMQLGQVLENEKPDMVLVHGDTSTSFAAALSAFYHHIPVGHVEAGLRTYNVQSPYPEEFNRQCVDMITDLFFAPTEYAKEQLLNEHKKQSQIFVTGNTAIDALNITVETSYYNTNIEWCENHKMILLTAHRRENIGVPMERIFEAVNKILDKYSDVRVIYPVHKNPKVRQIAQKYFGNNSKVRLIEPLDVYDFHNLMNKSYFILTDSGGIQEEAPSLGKPVLVLRDSTERQEGVMAGTLKVVGTRTEQVYCEIERLLTDKEEYSRMSHATNPYGDGYASKRIVEIIKEYLKGK